MNGFIPLFYKARRMKRYLLLLMLLVSSAGLVLSQCSPPVITASDTLICASDSTLICAASGYASYEWNTGEQSMCIYARDAGGYWVTVTTGNSCTVTSNHVNIYVYPVPSVSIIEQNDTLASFGESSYQWFHNDTIIPGATGQVYIVTIAGNYSVLITDSNGCVAFSSAVYVTPGQQRFSVSVGQNQSVCAGSLIILSPQIADGSGNYGYAWAASGDALSCYNCQYPEVAITQQDVFTVTVTDLAYGTASASVQYFISDTLNGSLPVLSFINTNVSCSQPLDTTTLSITGTGFSYNVNWGDNTLYGTGVTNIAHTYTQAGVYTVSVTDSFSCVTSAFDTIINNGLIISPVQEVWPSCNYSDNGRIVISVTGGTPPYSYSWGNGVINDSINYLSAGDYPVTVTDAAYCSAVANFNLYQLDQAFYVYLQSNEPNCNSNGSIITSVSGGTPPYSYLWSNYDTTQNLTGYLNGYYSLNVTDSLGCTTYGAAYLYPGCYGIISGVVFIDSNNNCTFDSGEATLTGIVIEATNNGQTYYGYTDYNGYYAIQVQGSGTFTLSPYSYNYGVCGNLTLCNNVSQSVTLSGLGDSSTNNNFSFIGSSGFDLTLHPGWTSANPGFQKEYWIMPYNQAFTPYYGPATIVFTYDSNLVYQYSLSPMPVHDPAAHTLTWTVDSVPSPIWDWNNFRFQDFFLVPASLSLGYLLQSDFYITPAVGDCDTANNYFHFSEVVTGSHDPNEKTVSPNGSIYYEDSVLTYTIHFQNTGTDSTYFIIVTDTLSPNLDPATVVNVASSSPYSKFTISGTGILTWVFNPLRLVDSLTNPSGSKGFVMFTVKKRSGSAVGVIISNQASIVFDYNAPIITNRVADTVSLINGLPFISITTGPDVNIYPNPTADKVAIEATGFTPEWIVVYDVNGRMISKQRFIRTIDITPLSSGIYLIEVKNSDISVRNRLVKL